MMLLRSALRRSIFLVAALLPALAGCGALAPARQVAVWIVDGDDELAPDTPPDLENDVYSASRRQVRLKAALNETLALQLALRTAAPPAGPFDVLVSDLAGPGERLPAATSVALYRVHYVSVERFRSWYGAHTGRPAVPRLVPDMLVPWTAPRGGGPVILSEPRNEIVWLDLHVPPTAAPGEYRGRIEVRARGGTLVFAADLLLEVLPVALPNRRNLPVVCRVDPRDLLTMQLRWPRFSAEETRLLPGVPSHLAAVRLVNAAMQVFQAHRTTPILWASFPKFHPTGEGSVQVDWDDYDRLVSAWLDGSAFADGVRLEVWPLPVTLTYPDAERHGGVDAPAYGRLLAAYLHECQQHFAERGWLERAILRPCPPTGLTIHSVEQMRRVAAIVRQSEATAALVAHLPLRSLRGLGWYDAPAIELPDVRIWAPRALWFEPEALEREQQLGRQVWLMPDYPPYSGSLAVEALPSDARCLPWQAYRYGASALWIEDAATCAPTDTSAPRAEAGSTRGLVYPAEAFGLRDRPVPSVRLKRLRRGLLDYELLRLLEANGKQLLARRLAEQIVRWAGTAASLDDLLSVRETGWPREAGVYRLARLLMLDELAGDFGPSPTARQRQIDNLAQWGVLMSRRQQVAANVVGLRLSQKGAAWRAAVLVNVTNNADRPIQGRWTLASAPPGWGLAEDVVTNVDPGTRRLVRLSLDLEGLAYNIDGVYPFELAFESAASGSVPVPARLAVAACPPTEKAPTVDGRLEDWPWAASNALGDFRLSHSLPAERTRATDLPALPTQAFFIMDRDHLYVAVRCTLNPGEPPIWQSDNDVPIDGAIPWGQDVVEILLDPRGLVAGTSSDIYCLQVKPSGLLVARQGCRTDPPIGTCRPWPCGARVAVSVQRDVWIIELAIPLDSLGPEARRQRVWGVNVTRLDARRGEYSSWSGARGHCYLPQTLGSLIMLWP